MKKMGHYKPEKRLIVIRAGAAFLMASLFFETFTLWLRRDRLLPLDTPVFGALMIVQFGAALALLRLRGEAVVLFFVSAILALLTVGAHEVWPGHLSFITRTSWIVPAAFAFYAYLLRRERLLRN